ncbi:MAG: methylenetetrahydrofolate reductase [NAD(P)H] [Oscillospiraceae bacterium]|nr:methylenetetrahydrofolate reductase [NAD(P)H] [Oscillospiraceae bacterium]
MAIQSLYGRGRPVISMEIFPPKRDDAIQTIYDALARMAAYRPDFISVTYGAGGSGGRNRTAEIAAFIQREYGIESMAHLTCVGATRDMTRQTLEQMHQDGIRNVLVLRGDLPPDRAAAGEYAHAEELVRETAARNDFCIGAACYPEGHIDCESMEDDLQYLLRKQEAGTDFFVSQLFFDNTQFFRFLDSARAHGITLPISAGIMPILGRTQIERMIFMCGASLPSAIVRLLHRYENDPDDLRKAGIEYAAEQMEGLLAQKVDGVHLYSMNKPEIAAHCFTHIGYPR